LNCRNGNPPRLVSDAYIDYMNLGPEEVAHYLRAHPEFFEDHADMLTEIQLPHPHGGGAIPISERQIGALRAKNRILQEKLAELIRFGEENDAIADKMQRLAVLLLTFKRLSDLVHDLNANLRENFSVPHTAVRLWNFTGEDSELPEFAPTSADIHAVAESLVRPYCGTHIMDEIHHWFGEDAARLRSFAMVALRTRKTIGLLVMGSEDQQRFYPEMGTIYLTRLSELVSAALMRLAAPLHAEETNQHDQR
jgi:uncharacterized protein